LFEFFANEINFNLFLQGFQTPILTLFFTIITFFADPMFWLFYSALLFFKGKEKESFSLVSLILFFSLIFGFLKVLINRSRPSSINLIPSPDSYSFPSGHAGLISLVFTFYKKNSNLLFLIFIFLIGISRIYLGLHYVTDVVFGVIFGFILTKIFFRFEYKIKKLNLKLNKIGDELIILILILLGVLISFFVPVEYVLGYYLLGYYIGFIVYKNSNFKLKVKTNLEIIFGGLILVILFFIANSIGLIGGLVFFISGLFVTIIWPFLLKKFRL
jgi:membrane-associated phospholipid phosphatase